MQLKIQLYYHPAEKYCQQFATVSINKQLSICSILIYMVKNEEQDKKTVN